MKFEATYEPFWYELDQPIKVGAVDKFYFLKGSDPPKFHNGPSDETSVVERKCLIESIEHPDFGNVAGIDTSGLEYTITLSDGRAFKVEAEESPGDVYDFPIKPKSWVFAVTLQVVEESGRSGGNEVER